MKDNLNFRFLFTPNDACAPTNLVNRIATAYHEREVEEAAWTFANIDDVRFAIWSTVATILPICSEHSEIGEPDVVVVVKPRSLKDEVDVRALFRWKQSRH